MHTELGCENLMPKFYIVKLRPQLNVFDVTIHADPQFSWKLLNLELLHHPGLIEYVWQVANLKPIPSLFL